MLEKLLYGLSFTSATEQSDISWQVHRLSTQGVTKCCLVSTVCIVLRLLIVLNAVILHIME